MDLTILMKLQTQLMTIIALIHCAGTMSITTTISLSATDDPTVTETTTTMTTSSSSETSVELKQEMAERIIQSFTGSVKRKSKKESRSRKSSGRAKEARSSNKRRRHRHRGMKQRSCRVVSRYVRRHEAEDIWGNIVTIHPYINIGEFQIDQMFYESYCHKEKCKCSGIDESKYSSSCETDYSFTYARVMKREQVGWTHIKVRSGCSCVIRERDSAGRIHLTDIL